MSVNAPAQPLSGTMDVDAFMAFLETRPNKEHWELIEGVAMMMAPASPAHQLIAFNFCSLLNGAFAAHGLALFACSDVGIRNTGLRNFQPQPDVVVLPGVAGYDLYSEGYRLAAEILSPSNRGRDNELKLRRYREAPDNLYAVVIEPREFLVEINARNRNWQPTMCTRADDPIEMPEFGLSFRAGALYRGTPLDPQGRRSQ
jgi:Uma2 family endonuclease